MEVSSLVTKITLALVLGAVLGLEREVNEKKLDKYQGKPTAIIGLRTFSLISLLGTIAGLLYDKFFGLSLIIGGAFLILLIVFYIIDALETKEQGITTEIAMIFSFVIGLVLALELLPVHLLLAVTVIVVLLLSQKERIKDVVEDIKKSEVNAFISFALIAIVILPFLPNTTYSLADITGIGPFLENLGVNVQKIAHLDVLNPFKLWLIVALITGVDLIGYVLERTIGSKKGWLIASGVGGFVSSTATTQSLAQESRTRRSVNHLVSAALLANMVSFVQVAILIGALNGLLLVKLLPVLGFMCIAAAGLLIYFLRVKDEKEEDEKTVIDSARHSIIDIAGALKFALLFLTISVFSKIALEFFGNSGFLIATAIGSLIGLDAVMINTAQLAGNNIDFTLAALAFILANAVNLFGKSFYSFYQGKREFAMKFFISVLIIIIASLVSLIFI